eukprot:1157896-Pelagomonas_calceolata.AAC.11
MEEPSGSAKGSAPVGASVVVWPQNHFCSELMELILLMLVHRSTKHSPAGAQYSKEYMRVDSGSFTWICGI